MRPRHVLISQRCFPHSGSVTVSLKVTNLATLITAFWSVTNGEADVFRPALGLARREALWTIRGFRRHRCLYSPQQIADRKLQSRKCPCRPCGAGRMQREGGIVHLITLELRGLSDLFEQVAQCGEGDRDRLQLGPKIRITSRDFH